MKKLKMKKMFTKISYLVVSALMSATLLTPAIAPVAAAEACTDANGFLGLPTWWRGLGCDSNNKPELSSPKDIWKIVLNIIEVAMTLAAYTAIGFVIWGGFKYLTSDGDEGKIKSGRQIIVNALIGLGIAFGSVAMVNFVAGLL